MASLKQVCGYLGRLAPLSYAAKWDNVGLIVEPSVGEANYVIHKILLTNDLTTPVMKEAIEQNANLIITYHPPIFGKGFMKMQPGNIKQNIILQCIENKIAVYCPHTASDCAKGGVNDWLISSLLKDSTAQVQPAAPCDDKDADPTEIGFGRIALDTKPFSLDEMLQNVKTVTGLEAVSLAKAYDKPTTNLTSIGVCAGSGGSVLGKAEVDLIVTGEMSHHVVLEQVERGVHVILTNHTNTERGYLPKLAGNISAEFNKSIECIVSKVDKDPQQFVFIK